MTYVDGIGTRQHFELHSHDDTFFDDKIGRKGLKDKKDCYYNYSSENLQYFWTKHRQTIIESEND